MIILGYGVATSVSAVRRSLWRPSIAFFSTSKHNHQEFRVKIPEPKLKSWQSGAQLVKNTKVENEYLRQIREVHDPSMHVKTIEDELKGTIGKALGKQAQKIHMYQRAMEQQRNEYETLQEQSEDQDPSLLQKCVQQHNENRRQAIQARWELMVHRQAVGFLVGNHKFVMEQFPIADALPTAETDSNKLDDVENTPAATTEKLKPKQFTDQLDWWQRIGRWR